MRNKFVTSNCVGSKQAKRISSCVCIFEISQIKNLRQFKISEKIMMIYFMTLKKKKNLRLKCCKVMLFLQWGEIRKTLVSLKLKTAKNEEKNLKS